MKIYDHFIDSDIIPKIIKLKSNIHILSFSTMKILPAYFMLNEAIKKGMIKQDTVIIESSSGSFALGLALTCNKLKLKLHIVSDYLMDINLIIQLRYLGAVIHIITDKIKPRQVARFDLLEKLRKEITNHYWPRQFDNCNNRKSYQVVADLISDSLDTKQIILVGPVGSGGSTCGIAEFLREKNIDVYLVGIDLFYSILFGLKDDRRLITAMGNSVMPTNLIHEYFDRVYWVSNEYVTWGTIELLKNYGIFSGPTTGSTYAPGIHLSESFPDINILMISPDSGHRYMNSCYNQKWIESNLKYYPKSICEFKQVYHPNDVVEPISFMNWDRMNLDSIKKE